MYLIPYKALPPVGIIKSPAVFIAVGVQTVFLSLPDQATNLGSSLDPIATKCLSLVTTTDWLPVGALVTAVAIVSGVQPAPESGFH